MQTGSAPPVGSWLDAAAMNDDGQSALDAPTLSGEERALADAVAARRDDLVALVQQLVRCDTTSRSGPGVPARDEAALQAALAERLEGSGFEVDVWEPTPEHAAGHPLSVEGLDFEGRPQLAATLRGTGGGRSLLLNGHIDVVPARLEDGWEQDPFDPVVVDGAIVGRGTADMKGGIAAMVVAAQVLAEAGPLRGDLVVCTNTDEESSGAGGLACVRHGVTADLTIVPEPSSLEVWPACRGTVYCTVTITGRAGHAEQEHPHWCDGGAVSAVEKGRLVCDALDALAREWRTRADLKHPLLDPPDLVITRFVADAGWHVTIPDRCELDFSVLISCPSRPTSTGGPPRRSGRSRRTCGAGATRTPGWPSTRRSCAGTPRSTRPRRPWTPRTSARCSARTPRSGCRPPSAGSAAGTTERLSRSKRARPR